MFWHFDPDDDDADNDDADDDDRSCDTRWPIMRCEDDRCCQSVTVVISDV